MLGTNEFQTDIQRVNDGIKKTKEQAALKNDVEYEKRKLGRD